MQSGRRPGFMGAVNRFSPDMVEGTKRRIIQMAGRLFSERSYLGVSMNDIAERLGITKPALYYHFPSKMDLYSQVLDEGFAGLREVIIEASREEDPERTLHQLVKNYLDFGMRERNLLNVLVVTLSPDETDLRARVVRFRQELADRIEPVVRDTIQNSTSRMSARADARCLAEMLVALMDGLLVEYVFLNRSFASGEVADQILAVLGLRDTPPPVA
jgi:AcrR family transcriptional regulator